MITTFKHKLGWIANVSAKFRIKPIGYGKGYTKQEALDAANEWLKSTKDD